MEFIVNLFSWIGSFLGTVVDFGSYVQSNIVILLIAVVVFAIATVVLRSVFKILLFIPVLIVATMITIWVVNTITNNNPTQTPSEDLPALENLEA